LPVTFKRGQPTLASFVFSPSVVDQSGKQVHSIDTLMPVLAGFEKSPARFYTGEPLFDLFAASERYANGTAEKAFL
jgi:hypothetical protein